MNFGCTQCGKCCRDLKLPLTVAEAVAWLRDGHDVQILCDATPWPAEPGLEDLKAAHRRRRSFAAISGSLPTRVVAILAANLAGACPNLRGDHSCGIYARRPLVCRIYPAEINPFKRLVPADKACPPEAWAADRPLLQRQGRVVDAVVREDIQQSRDTDARDTQVKRRLCAVLDFNCAALAEEGFIVYSPERAVLLAALERAVEECGTGRLDAPLYVGSNERPPLSWHFVSKRAETIDSLIKQCA